MMFSKDFWYACILLTNMAKMCLIEESYHGKNYFNKINPEQTAGVQYIKYFDLLFFKYFFKIVCIAEADFYFCSPKGNQLSLVM